MTEPDLIAWFAAHPFTRNLCVAGFSGVCAMIKADYDALQKHRETDPTAEWGLWVALRRYVIGIAVTVGPMLAAEVLHVLGTS